MSLIVDPERNAPVHFPNDPLKFSFDEEVSTIFENMAERSIPNFRAAHDAHVSMLAPWLAKPKCRILDVGASRGSFISAIERTAARPGLDITAIDISPEMCRHLREDHPAITVRCMDVASPEFLDNKEKYDVVCAHYILQFIPADHQQAVLSKLMQMVKFDGVFIHGHKESHTGTLGDAAHEEYIKWRLKNGYTRKEIMAKTIALRGSMFPMNHQSLMQIVRANFKQTMETFRFMMFSTSFSVK